MNTRSIQAGAAADAGAIRLAYCERAPDLAAMNVRRPSCWSASHDFAAFGAATTESGVTVRKVLRAEWR